MPGDVTGQRALLSCPLEVWVAVVLLVVGVGVGVGDGNGGGDDVAGVVVGLAVGGVGVSC